MTSPESDLAVHEPRVRFYLDNYRHIEEWAKLRAEAAAALGERLQQLVPLLEEDARERGDCVVRVADLEVGGYPRAVVERSSWRQDGEESSPVGVALEWERSVIDRSGALKLYVGVRASSGHPRHEELADRVKALGSGLRAELGKGWTGSGATWVCYRYVRPTGDALDEVALFAEARRTTWALWDRVVGRLDALLIG